MFAQISIKGTYDSNNKIFNTYDKTYWIDFFKDGIAKISNNGLMGLMDTSGTILCMPKYDIIHDFQDDMATVGLKGKYGLIKINGKELAEPQFEMVKKVNQNLFLVKVNSKYGIIRDDGSFLSDIKYYHLQVTRDKNIVFYNGDDIGLIDLETGAELPVFKYKKEYLTNNIGLDVFQYIRFIYGYRTNAVLEFNDGLAITYGHKGNTILFGFMDRSFKTVIEPQYDWVEPFKNGYALVLKNGNWGVIDKTGQSVLPMEFESIQILDNQKFLVSKDGKYGVLDNYKNAIIPIKYNSLFYMGNSLLATYNGEKWGVINEKEKLILDYEYDGVTDGLAVKYDGNIGIFHTAIPRATYYFNGYYFDENGLLDKKNIRISKFVEGHHDFSKNPEGFIPYSIESDNGHKTQKYDYKETINNQFKIVGNKIKEDDKLIMPLYSKPIIYSKGIINSKEEIIIPLIYDDIIQQNGSNIFIVKKNNKYGIINIENKFIINPEHDGIEIIGGVIVVLNIIEPNRRLERAVFDFTGKMIIPFKDSEYKEGNAGALMTNYQIIDKQKI